MKIQRILTSLPLIACCFMMISSARAAGVSGRVTVEDQSSNTESVSTSAQPNGTAAGTVVAPRNVIVYAAPGAIGQTPSTKQPMSIAQDGCHFTEAILHLGFVPIAPYTGQMVNSATEEIIPVKCDSKTGARKYFVVLKTTHFSVTDENGVFSLSNLAPGKYTITAWHANYGTQSQEVTITGDEIVPANFVFRPKSKA